MGISHPLRWTALALAAAASISVGIPVPSSGDAAGRLSAEQAAAALNPRDAVRTITLLRTVDQQGISEAMDRLSQSVDRSRTDGQDLPDAHALAHAIGAYGVMTGIAPNEAYRSCRPGFDWGCYHGVIEQYLPRAGELTAERIPSICSVDLRADEVFRAQLECEHGLGHALARMQDIDLQQALALCDALQGQDGRANCWNGVFMEHALAAREAMRAGRPHPTTDPDDPMYPCTAVASRHAGSCYETRAPVLAQILGGNDWQEMFVLCSRPRAAGLRQSCYRGIGALMHGTDPGEEAIARSGAICEQAGPEGKVGCLLGLTGNLTPEPELVASICMRLRGTSGEEHCYARYGERLAWYGVGESERSHLCREAARRFADACVRGTIPASPDDSRYAEAARRLASGAVACDCDLVLAADLLRRVDEQGLRAALTMIDRSRAQGVITLSESHTYGHWAGEYAQERGGSYAATIVQCLQEPVHDQIRVGCVHGAGIGFVGAQAELTPAKLALACSGEVYELVDCWHGLGHAIVERTGIDLERSLSFCDAVPHLGGREDCAFAVYLESGALARAHHGNGVALLRQDDPTLPCSTAPAFYQKACWTAQPWNLQFLFADDWARTARVCFAAGPYAPNCANGAGRLFANAAATGADITRVCSAFEHAQDDCEAGALVLSPLPWREKQDRCGRLRVELQGLCYRAPALDARQVGEGGTYEERCRALPSDRREACLQAMPARP